MVADAIERLNAQVERLQRDVGTPEGVVKPADKVWRQRIFAGVAARTVPAVVSNRHCLGEGNIQAQCLRNRPCDLGHFERVGHSCALMVFGKDEHLRFAGEPTKRGVVENTVAVAFEAGAMRIGGFFGRPVASTVRTSCEFGKGGIFVTFAFLANKDFRCPDFSAGVGVSKNNVVSIVARHG
jgi:hypothetical protein